MAWIDNKTFNLENLYLSNLNSADFVTDRTPMRKYYDGKTVKEIINNIKDSKLKLSIHENLITVVSAKDYVDQIFNVLKQLNNIAARPKTFIITEENKEHIMRAKKINSKAMFYLSRDSGDWEIRKANSIIPRKILSDVYNETYNIYENIVFCDLIYLIDAAIKESKKAFEDKIKQDGVKVIGSSITQRKYFKETVESQPDDEIDSNKLNTYMKTIKKIESNIRKIKGTNFFKSVSKAWHKQYSIQRTNLFVFDKNYKFVYKLWLFLYKKQKQEQKVPEITVSKSKDFEAYYFNYSVLSFLAVLNPEVDKRIKFLDGTENNKVSIKPNGFIDLNNNIKFSINNKTLEFGIIDNCIKLTSEKVIQEEQKTANKRQIINTRQTTTEEFYVYPTYFIKKDLLNIKSDDFFGFSDEDIMNLLQNTPPENPISQTDFFEKYTTALLNQNKHNEPKQHVFYLLPITTFGGDNIVTEDKILKRLFGLGGMYDPDDKDAKDWRFFKRGILQVTPRGYNNSFNSISRLINLLVVFNDTMDDYTKDNCCPICNSHNIQKTGKDRICYDCGCLFSINTLTSYHDKHMLWIKQDNDRIQKVNENIKYNDHIREIIGPFDINEIICAHITTASFVLDQDTNEVKTICPVCGKISHD